MYEVGVENYAGETQTLSAHVYLSRAYEMAKQMIDNPELISQHVEIESPYVQIFIDRFINESYEAAVFIHDFKKGN